MICIWRDCKQIEKTFKGILSKIIKRENPLRWFCECEEWSKRSKPQQPDFKSRRELAPFDIQSKTLLHCVVPNRWSESRRKRSWKKV